MARGIRADHEPGIDERVTAAIADVGLSPLHRFRYPSQAEMWERIKATNDGTMPAEPAVRKGPLPIRRAASLTFAICGRSSVRPREEKLCT